MFDIGFAELLVIGVVALLVIGPERLPQTVRTASLWLNRIRRGFNDIKQEIQQELHNDEVMRELRETGNQLKNEADTIGRDLKSTSESLNSPVDIDAPADEPDGTPGEKAAE
jgi:sec-independent protein translocase protein TatB